MNHPIVILGSGLAGVTLARELRKLTPTREIVMITGDDGDFYAKPSLSNALAAGKSPAQLRLTQADRLASQLSITLLARTQALSLHPADALLRTSAGDLSYGQLVLALGASQMQVPVLGDGAQDVLSVNDLADYAEFRRRLDGRHRVAIIGAGLIGCEFANDLRCAGIEARVFDLAPQPLGRLLPPQASAFLRRRLEQAGVEFQLSTTVTRVDRQGKGYRLTDREGRPHEADLVLSAVGLSPRLALARAAALHTGRGIAVDRHLCTSVPNIYALGDCAEVEGWVLPYVPPIMQAARALAPTLLGQPTRVSYPAMPVGLKTPACPAVVCPPPHGLPGAWQETGDADGVRAIFSDPQGQVRGFALLGDMVPEKTAWTGRIPAWL